MLDTLFQDKDEVYVIIAASANCGAAADPQERTTLDRQVDKTPWLSNLWSATFFIQNISSLSVIPYLIIDKCLTAAPSDRKDVSVR